MSIRSIIVLVLAVICGLSAAVGMNRLRGSTEPGETGPVVLAKVDLPRGETLTADMLKIVNWPKDMIPAHVLTTMEEAIDRAAAVPIVKGDLIFDAKLAPKNAGRGIAALVPPGMRAYTIQTSKIAANVAGFVLPGNRVDVLLTLRSHNSNDESGGGSSMTLLQAVEILAINQRLDAPAENRTDSKELQSVTLLVAPQQVELLDLGQNLGTLTLSLRNVSDTAETKTESPTLAKLLNFKAKIPMPFPTGADMSKVFRDVMKPVVAEPPKTWKIRTLRGTSPGEVVFEQK